MRPELENQTAGQNIRTFLQRERHFFLNSHQQIQSHQLVNIFLHVKIAFAYVQSTCKQSVSMLYFFFDHNFILRDVGESRSASGGVFSG